MRVFLTGATGFLGSFIVRELLKRQHKVAVLQRQNTNPWRIQDIAHDCQVIVGDLSNSKDWQEDFISFQPEAVIHAAWSGVENKKQNSLEQISNITDLHALLELMKIAGCSHFIGTGSQAEYGNHAGALDELTPTVPFTTYGAAKLAAYHWAKVQCQLAAIRCVWLRIFTIYGPSDNPHWIIPYLIKTLMAGESPALTSCEQKLGFLYVTDAARAYVDILENSTIDGVFNLGAHEVFSLLHTVKTIHNLVDTNIELLIGAVPYRENQIMHLEANINLLKSSINWYPTVSLEEGLQKVVQWHKANINSNFAAVPSRV